MELFSKLSSRTSPFALVHHLRDALLHPAAEVAHARHLTLGRVRPHLTEEGNPSATLTAEEAMVDVEDLLDEIHIGPAPSVALVPLFVAVQDYLPDAGPPVIHEEAMGAGAVPGLDRDPEDILSGLVARGLDPTVGRVPGLARRHIHLTRGIAGAVAELGPCRGAGVALLAGPGEV
jgi:hypothetical protein